MHRKRLCFYEMTIKRKLLYILLALFVLSVAAVLFINYTVYRAGRERLISAEEASEINADCILILGARVYADGVPSPMLSDRLDKGIELYRACAAPLLLMSGDNSSKEYGEVSAMRNYAVEKGVKSDDIYLDYAGFSTYESIIRAREIFGAERVIIVTQDYHLYRALYIAEQIGLDAYGVAAREHSYSSQVYREMREILARNKDFIQCIFRPEPTYMGEKAIFHNKNSN